MHFGRTTVFSLLPLFALTVFVGCEQALDSSIAEDPGSPWRQSFITAVERQQDREATTLVKRLALNSLREHTVQDLLQLATENHCVGTSWQLLQTPVAQDTSGPGWQNCLLAAYRRNEVWLAHELLSRGTESKGLNTAANNILSSALLEGKTALAKLFLLSGAPIENSPHEDPPLMSLVIENQNDWFLADILSQHSPQHFELPNGKTLAHQVAARGSLNQLQVLLKHPAALQAREQPLETPLHTAVAHGAFDMLASLATAGVSIAEPDQAGNTPLLLAIKRRDHACVEELLRLGAPPNESQPSQPLPLDLALELHEFTTAQALVNQGANTKGLVHRAVANNQPEQLRFLIRNQAPLDEPQKDTGETALERALLLEDSTCARLLIEAGLDPNTQTLFGQTAFHVAVAKLDASLIRTMLAHGAEPQGALAYPAQENFLKLVASPNISRATLKQSRNITPLLLAADSGRLEIARLLLQHGAKPDQPVRGGRYNRWYPISWAARRNDVPMMQLLLGRKPEDISRWAKVDLSKQRAWIFEGKEQLYTSRVSTGKSGYRTRTGSFVITQRSKNHVSSIYDSPMPYFQRLSCSDFGFHQGYVPGYPASHGCIRLPWAGAKKFWQLMGIGDRVEIVR